MADLGSIVLGLAFLCALLALSTLVYGIKKADGRVIEIGYRSLHGVFSLSVFASIVLVMLLVTHDFSIRYVYEYTSRDLPTIYTLTAFWAGQAGSLLFWELILAVFTIVVLWRYSRHPHLPVAAAVLSGVHIFFTFLLSFVSSPFISLPEFPADGLGLNPLLQNPGMIFHPPTQYLGYVGFTVPFAFAMAALIKREAGAEWIRRTRTWTLVAWSLLSVGIVSGGKWAYVELGWGGYWAWDPVENASFIPWAVATAFLHSVMIQQSKGMLKTWNVSLIALTFFFTIFGTFLTRSGVIQSVHSFGGSNLGLYFLTFLLLIAAFSMYLIIDRSHLLKDENAFEGLLSKESSFLFNNVLFLGLAFVTFWGTIFPIVSEAVTGKKVTVGPPFFDQMNGPIFLGVIVLTGICPLIAWRRSSLPKLSRHLLVPLTAGLAVLLTGLLYLRQPAAALTYGSAAFVAAGMLYDLLKEVRVRKGFHPGEKLPVAAWNLMRMRSRKYGGYFVHFGVVLMAVGVMTSHAFKREVTVRLRPGAETQFAGYSLKYNGIRFVNGPGKTIADGDLQVQRLDHGNRPAKRWQLRPAKIFHAGREQPHTEVAILRVGVSDLYAILSGFTEPESDGANRIATFKLIFHPGINLIWTGFNILLLGVAISLAGPALWRKRKRGRRR
jgi:cytochrome c-type biogenesis protein CcmF